VAESLGKLFAVYPTKLMTFIHDGLNQKDLRGISTVAKSVKYSTQKLSVTEGISAEMYVYLAQDLIGL
jgi:hypothetical protein